MAEKPIHNFKGLKDLLRAKGFEVEAAKTWRPIAGEDVISNYFFTNKLSFNQGPLFGITFKDEKGNAHIGFLYKKEYMLKDFGKPRMHVCECQTIASFKNRNCIDQYRFAETKTVMVVDLDNNNKETKVDKLPLCSFCRKKLEKQGKFGIAQNSNDYAALLNPFPKKTSENEKDIFGYTKDWPKISLAYRKKKRYTCEKCSIKISNGFDRQFIQVHHIDGNKENNREQNLLCLCVKCHSLVDDIHKKNFSTGANMVIINDFVKKYRDLPHNRNIW